jgi:hypothetical protein
MLLLLPWCGVEQQAEYADQQLLQLGQVAAGQLPCHCHVPD